MNEPAVDEALQRLWRLGDYATPLTLRAVCDLGVADELQDGALPVDVLAKRVSADPDALVRAMRLLVANGVFVEADPGCFALNELSSMLCTGHPVSAGQTLSILPADVQAWAEVSYSLKTGQPAFHRVHGADRWAYLAEHEADGVRFHNRMRSASRRMGRILAQAYPWAGTEHVVDVGGGSGGVLAELLAAHPRMSGSLFDQPHVVADAQAVLGVNADRCVVVGGDFFTGVPAGGDVYLLVNVLHDWADEPAARILGSVADRIRGRARLLIVEGVPGVEGAPSRSGSLDMHMMVVWGGRERRLDQWETMVPEAGLSLVGTRPAGHRWIIECAARGD